jgi:predicted enzyme related to lactoylglutathione lyase
VRKYHHLGIPTTQVRADEHYLPHLKVHVSGFESSPYGIEWMRFDSDCPVPDLVRRIPHVAFEVDDLETELAGKELLIVPNSPSPGVRVAFIVHNGAPVELLQLEARAAVRANDEGGPTPDQSPFIWHELVTADQPTSGAFFCQLLGWTRTAVDAGRFGTYTLFQKNGQDVAGMMNPTPDAQGEGPHWHSYIAVENADECAQRALSLGGSVVLAPHEVPDVGRVCVVADPTGAIADLLQPLKRSTRGGAQVHK